MKRQIHLGLTIVFKPNAEFENNFPKSDYGPIKDLKMKGQLKGFKNREKQPILRFAQSDRKAKNCLLLKKLNGNQTSQEKNEKGENRNTPTTDKQIQKYRFIGLIHFAIKDEHRNLEVGISEKHNN